MYDINQNPFYLYSVHRTSVSGDRSRANGPLVFFTVLENFLPFLSNLKLSSGSINNVIWERVKVTIAANSKQGRY